MPPQATLDLFEATRRRSLAAMLGVRSLWGRIDPDGDWAAQWSELTPRATVLVGSAQVGAAADGAASVAAGLTQAGYPEAQIAAANPRAFAGWMEDPDTGNVARLDRALAAPVAHARQAAGGAADMLAAGRATLEAITQAAVADAGRHAAQVQAVATERTVAVWYDPPPYCQRCAVLIGKRVKPTTQFVRHPRCDGAVRIMSERDVEAMEPLRLENVTDLTSAQLQAIEDGADFNQVVNAQTSVRGGRLGGSPLRDRGRRTIAGSGPGGRLTPKGIYDIAGDDRDRALELLREHGYITGRTIARTPVPPPALTIDGLDDDAVDSLMVRLMDEGRFDDADRIGELWDARTAAAAPKQWRPDARDAFNPATYEWFEGLTLDQQAHFVNQVSSGVRDAFQEQQWAWANAKTAPKRGLLPTERQVRAEWDAYIENEWVRLEEATNGHALTREAQADGRRLRDLWRVNEQTARSWASEETQRYWEENGRMTYAAFKAGYTGGVDALHAGTAGRFWA